MNTGLMTWENIYKKHKTRRSSFTSLNSSLLFSSSLLQRRNLKTKSKPAMRVVGSWRNISSKAVASPITKRLHRARRSAFLNSLERKVTTLPRKHFLTYKICESFSFFFYRHFRPVKILSDEDNDAEVGIEPVTYEERGEDEEPGCLRGQKLIFNLKEG